MQADKGIEATVARLATDAARLDAAYLEGNPLREVALLIAHKYDYADAAEREQACEASAATGYCLHELDPYCCPAVVAICK